MMLDKDIQIAEIKRMHDNFKRMSGINVKRQIKEEDKKKLFYEKYRDLTIVWNNLDEIVENIKLLVDSIESENLCP